jgi:tRNA (uracil-5-)-methyltransferase
MTDPSPQVEEEPKVADAEMKEAATLVGGGAVAPSIPLNADKKEEATATSTEAAHSDAAAALDASPVDLEWDHSNRRVMVYNVLKYIKNKDIPKAAKKWLESHEDPSSIVIKKWKKDPKASWVVLTCETEDMAEKLIQHINEKKVTNKKGKELIASKERKSEKRKRDGDDTDERGDNKRPPQGPMTDDQVRDKLTPLWRSSYEDQLKQKVKTMIKKCAMRVCSEVKKKFQMLQKEARRNPNREKVEVYAWLESNRSIEVEEVIASPTQHAYRNKCEFTFGYRLEKEGEADEKKIPSSGFMAAGWSGGVSRPHLCPNVPWEACAIAELMEEFLQTSPMPPYEARNHTGMWRVLTIRSSQRTKECMIILQHAPTTGAVASGNMVDYSDVFESEKARLVKLFVDRDLPMVKRPTDVNETHFPLRVTSIFFQEYEGLSTPPPEHPVQHVYGKTSLTEKLGDCHFQISPGAFFQVNTQCAELLYQVVVKKIKEVSPSNSILLDVCCGTGSIGLTCIKQGAVSEVVGVDISQPAITDADANAKLNGLEDKVRFIASKAETVMGQETNRLSYSEQKKSVVAVVDPAREGLHPDVVRSIRMTEKIQRLVYVSCNPTGSLIQDAVILCAPPTKRFKGRAFRPTFAQPVDMFPLSDHCEMVMVFDRLTEEDEKGVKEAEATKEVPAAEMTDKKDAEVVDATEEKNEGAEKPDASKQGEEKESSAAVE